MNNDVTVEATDETHDLVEFALNHGIGSVRSSKGPLVPFVVVEAKGERSLQRYVGNTLEEGVVTAQHSIASLPSDVERYAIAYDAYILYEDHKYDAIVVEVGERGQDFAYKFAQRYIPKRGLKPFKTVGIPCYLGHDMQRLKEAT